jgi:hypothetical protein
MQVDVDQPRKRVKAQLLLVVRVSQAPEITHFSSEATPMFPIVISSLQTADEVEIVERKGIGHPDTICDALAETLSRNLCREYQRRFGEILHHNVDKALLCGGRAVAAFGGGSIIAPIMSRRASDS